MRRRIPDKRDRVRQLRVFCTAVRFGSLTGAAGHLGLTQPAVSLQVRELEHELGAVLLERSSEGVTPTPAGERLHARAEPLVRGVDALFDNLDACLDGEGARLVRLGVTGAGAAFVLPRHIERFRERCPETVVRLDTATLREGLARLLDERVDFVVGTLEPHPHDALDYQELLTYRLVLITPLDHALAGRETVTVREAGAWPAVVAPPELYSRQDGESAARALGLDVNAVLEVGGWGVLKRYVEAGFGVAAVPSLVVSETDRLSVASLEGPLPVRSYGVYTHRDRALTPPARRLLEVLSAGIPAPTPSHGGPVR